VNLDRVTAHTATAEPFGRPIDGRGSIAPINPRDREHVGARSLVETAGIVVRNPFFVARSTTPSDYL
jgi:hypothetical protein